MDFPSLLNIKISSLFQVIETVDFGQIIYQQTSLCWTLIYLLFNIILVFKRLSFEQPTYDAV